MWAVFAIGAQCRPQKLSRARLGGAANSPIHNAETDLHPEWRVSAKVGVAEAGIGGGGNDGHGRLEVFRERTRKEYVQN